MDQQTFLDAIDDPTLRETMLDGAVTRRSMLRRSAGAAVAAVAIPTALAALAGRASAQSAALPNVIVNALNIALILENLEAQFYVAGLAASGLIPAADRTIFAQISKHETAHVAFLKTVLGSRAAMIPTFDFTAGGALDTLTNYDTFKLVSQAFEDFGVRAYKGQAGNLAANDVVLTAALQIHSVEARHASEIRRLRGQKGWITGAEPGAPAAVAAVYAGEGNTIQAGIDVSKYAGVDAATEAFDEPVTDVRYVLQTISPFIKK